MNANQLQIYVPSDCFKKGWATSEGLQKRGCGRDQVGRILSYCRL
jgi:hypothetical protein